MDYGFLRENLAYIKQFCGRFWRCPDCPLFMEDGNCAVTASGPPEQWKIEDMVQIVPQEENNEL